MAFLQKDKLFSKQGLKNYSLIVIGSFILAASFVLFVTPYKIVPGGVYGISIVLHYLFGTPVGMMALAFDIPLTIIGIKVLGPRFGVKTVVGFVLTAVFVDTLTYFYGTEPLVENDALLSSVFGGLFMGVGLGLIFKSRATSGGTDIVAMMLSKFTRLPVGQLMIAVDSTIVLLGLIVFKDWKIPLYSLIVIFVTGKVIDTILEGMNYDKVLLIVSDQMTEIRLKIFFDLNRGGTLLKGEGLYSEEERPVLLTVVNRRETVMLQYYINQIDPDAFVTVINANEILGNGFKSLREKVEE
jgi:uncharacterized membrane-anchored protein YitT (DUF2179 family)